MNTIESVDPAFALTTRWLASTPEDDDVWLGCESTHPLTWIPGSPAWTSPAAALATTPSAQG